MDPIHLVDIKAPEASSYCLDEDMSEFETPKNEEKESRPRSKNETKLDKLFAQEKFVLKMAYRSKIGEMIVSCVAIIILIFPSQIAHLLITPEDWEKMPETLKSGGMDYIFIAVAALILLPALFSIIKARLTHKYIIGQFNVKTILGFIKQERITVSFTHIQGVELNISALGRIFNFGDLEIATAATNDKEIKLMGIYNPERLNQEINRRLLENREKGDQYSRGK